MRFSRETAPDWAAFLVLAFVHRAWSLAMPLQQGRDFVTYMSWYAQFFRAEPVDHLLMLYRTPGTPLFFGGLDALGGPVLVDAALTLLFAASLACLFRQARLAWGAWAAWAVLILLALAPSYNWAWHTVASESLACGATALMAAACLRAFREPRPGTWAVLGLSAFALAMARPSCQIFLLLALGAFFLPRLTLAVRARLFAAAAAPFLVLATAWAGHNGLRYGEFALTRGGAAIIPAYRVFLWERLMKPENGPASRALAEAVARDLLPRPEYRDRRIDLEIFFSAGDSFMFADLIPLCDRTWGWPSNYSVLRRAALEAVAAHPGAYLAGLADTIRLVFSSSEHDLFAKARQRWPEPSNVARHRERLGLGPPALPGQVELLSNSSVYWLSSGSGRFAHLDADFLEVRAREADYQERYPDFLRAMSVDRRALLVWTTLSKASSWFFVFPLLGLLALRERSPRAQALRWLYATSALMLVATYMGTDAVIQFRNPFDPVFVLAGVAGGARVSAPAPREGLRPGPARG